jgi:hypothetical protein
VLADTAVHDAGVTLPELRVHTKNHARSTPRDATPCAPGRQATMQWFDLSCRSGDPGGASGLSPEFTPSGLALELHVCARAEGILAIWVLEDGRVLGKVGVGAAVAW